MGRQPCSSEAAVGAHGYRILTDIQCRCGKSVCYRALAAVLNHLGRGQTTEQLKAVSPAWIPAAEIPYLLWMVSSHPVPYHNTLMENVFPPFGPCLCNICIVAQAVPRPGNTRKNIMQRPNLAVNNANHCFRMNVVNGTCHPSYADWKLQACVWVSAWCVCVCVCACVCADTHAWHARARDQ